jgi:hypothetical protein
MGRAPPGRDEAPRLLNATCAPFVASDANLPDHEVDQRQLR